MNRGTAATAAILLLLLQLTHAAAEDASARTNDTQLARVARYSDTARGMDEDYYQHHDVEKPKAKPWLGYYDFLITEGSYKFWVVFQLFTIGVLIYSAFAAIYYAKYTVNDYESYDDYLLKRSARTLTPNIICINLESGYRKENKRRGPRRYLRFA